MGIRFFCPHCKKRLNIKEFLAGKRGYCPECGGSLEVPLQSDPAALRAAAKSQRVAVQSLAPELSGKGAVDTEPTTANSSHPATHESPGRPSEGEGPVSLDLSEKARPNESPPGAIDLEPPASGTLQESRAVLDLHGVWFVRTTQGKQFGPMDGPALQSWINEGLLWPTMYLWREGWPTWRIAREVLPEQTWQHSGLWGSASGVGSPLDPKTDPLRIIARYERRKRRQRQLWAGAVVVLLVLAIALTITLIAVLRRPTGA